MYRFAWTIKHASSNQVMLELIFCDRVLNLYGFLIYPLNLCKVTKYMYKPFSLSNEYQCVENFAQTVLKISQVSDIHDKNCVCEKRRKFIMWPNIWRWQKIWQFKTKKNNICDFMMIWNSIFHRHLLFDVVFVEGAGKHKVTQWRISKTPLSKFTQISL